MGGAASVLDRAFVALRRAGLRTIARAWMGGALVGWVALVAYHLEMVEGVRTLRPLFGALFVAAFWGRSYLLAGVARALVAPLLPQGAEMPEPRFSDVARTASVVGIGLFVWLWLPVLGTYFSVLSAAILVLPLALRGGVAPTWIARAGCERVGGLGAFLRSFDDLGRDRFLGIRVELFVILAGLALYVNLLGALGLTSLLGRSFLGLDVADLETFLSVRNTFVLLVLGVVAAVAIEPLRAAVSAVLYVEARARREGFDLETAIASLARLTKPGAVAAIPIALVLAFAAPAGAQLETPDVAGLSARDEAIQQQVRAILARDEFRELDGVSRGRTLVELAERFFEWLFEGRDFDFGGGDAREASGIPMPPAWIFLVLAGVALAAVLAFTLKEARGLAGSTEAEGAKGDALPDPRDVAPEAHLDEAARLAAAGKHREAFRALYLATLVALDRRGAIRFDRTHTNWHYLRSMPSGATREAFHRFTALFDRKWYGDEGTSPDEYLLGRELADRICRAGDGDA